MSEKDSIQTEEAVKTEEIKEEHGHKKHRHSKEEFDKLELRIAELEGENLKLQNEYFKAYADTQNLRKRLEADFEVRQKYRIQSFAVDILPAIDNLERAMLALDKVDENSAKGVEMVYNQLINALKKEGVEVIDPLNQTFDPNYHQGLSTEAIEGVEPNIVIQVFQKGYKLKDRILRPALVKISE